MYGPQLPPNRTRATTHDDEDIGPQLPPTVVTDDDSKPQPEPVSNAGSDSEEDSFGPVLPPHLLAARKMQRRDSPSASSDSAPSDPPRRRVVAGPTAPPPGFAGVGASRQEDSDDEFGPAPMPKGAMEEEDELRNRIAEIEARARRAKEEQDKANRPEKLERGEWMLVPPEANRLPIAGPTMKSRQFSKTAVEKEVDQSGWTETPQDRADKRSSEKRKRSDKEEPRPPTEEELQTQEFIRKHNERHRGKALMDEHMTTYMKDGKYKDEDVSKRRFDRDKDIAGGRRIDAKGRQEMLEKARKLDSKFGHGSKTYL